MTRAILVVAGVYVAGAALYYWLDDPCLRRDSTYERAFGCPIAVARHQSAR